MKESKMGKMRVTKMRTMTKKSKGSRNRPVANLSVYLFVFFLFLPIIIPVYCNVIIFTMSRIKRESIYNT